MNDVLVFYNTFHYQRIIPEYNSFEMSFRIENKKGGGVSIYQAQTNEHLDSISPPPRLSPSKRVKLTLVQKKRNGSTLDHTELVDKLEKVMKKRYLNPPEPTKRRKRGRPSKASKKAVVNAEDSATEEPRRELNVVMPILNKTLLRSVKNKRESNPPEPTKRKRGRPSNTVKFTVVNDGSATEDDETLPNSVGKESDTEDGSATDVDSDSSSGTSVILLSTFSSPSGSISSGVEWSDSGNVVKKENPERVTPKRLAKLSSNQKRRKFYKDQAD